MGIFKKKKPEPIRVETQGPGQIEIELAKGATREAAQEAQAANEKLNELLVENGFTIKIYLAAGGKHKGRQA